MICSMCAADNPINGRYGQNCGALLQGQREASSQSNGSAPTALCGRR